MQVRRTNASRKLQGMCTFEACNRRLMGLSGKHETCEKQIYKNLRSLASLINAVWEIKRPIQAGSEWPVRPTHGRKVEHGPAMWDIELGDVDTRLHM